ncbi:uncharacterized protein C8Q71DRAFT_495664 [Rhodofomes roseus]|uniref:Uncharacterized protein n=1 Tax=Rhodofomes roseus TaxID=34475 RepID=A0ABQ8KM21_9APHY|nr:uncharacterized protein C8Q71DRAFT_495664 [Rhodofomes roseus]KAH9839098.1 hypothetical protein C8Q71DRAFT_495664 [Rhodofomes roseus]
MMDTSYESLLSYMALANDTGTATSSDVDDYNSFIFKLEYINEADIAVLDLLPNLPSTTSVQPADHDLFEVSSSSINTASSIIETTEDNDIPLVSHHCRQAGFYQGAITEHCDSSSQHPLSTPNLDISPACAQYTEDRAQRSTASAFRLTVCQMLVGGNCTVELPV